MELTGAIARDWADILEGIPRDVLQRACLKYMRSEPRRKPTPGAIYALSLAEMPRPVLAYSQPADPRPEPERISADRANEICTEFGFRPQRMPKGGE